MSTTFPRAHARILGYSVEEVENFLDEARRAYGTDRPDLTSVNAASIRRTAFSMERGGYATSFVDAALERLEDAFAMRERDRIVAETSESEWYGRARATAQAIIDRLDRPVKNRFDRVPYLAFGYRVSDVDAFGDRLAEYFQHGKPLTPETVRTVVFRRQRGGYSEAQVDLLLDAVVGVMQAVR